MSFDVTGSRLVTCEADKTIKMWKEVRGRFGIGCQAGGAPAPTAPRARRACSAASSPDRAGRPAAPLASQDETATPESHPIDFRPPKDIKRF